MNHPIIAFFSLLCRMVHFYKHIKICATPVSPHSTRPTGLPRTQHCFCVSILTVFIIWNLMLFHYFMHFICLSTVA